VRSESSDKQNVRLSAGSSCERKLCACFSLPADRDSKFDGTVYPPYKRWGSVVDLTRHLQGSTPYGIRFSHKTYRPSPTKDVTWKDPPFIRGPLKGG
jgi:hypothetical protein